MYRPLEQRGSSPAELASESLDTHSWGKAASTQQSSIATSCLRRSSRPTYHPYGGSPRPNTPRPNPVQDLGPQTHLPHPLGLRFKAVPLTGRPASVNESGVRTSNHGRKYGTMIQRECASFGHREKLKSQPERNGASLKPKASTLACALDLNVVSYTRDDTAEGRFLRQCVLPPLNHLLRDLLPQVNRIERLMLRQPAQNC